MSTSRKPAKVVCEIGCCHQGDLDIAKEMIVVAAKVCKVDVVKFQKRNVKDLLTDKEYNRPYTGPHSFGATYGEHRNALEFSMPEHYLLKEICEENGVEYGCSVWDITSAKQIVKLNPAHLKIPAAKNHKIDMIKWVLDNYGGLVHVSLGMATNEEVLNIRELTHKYPCRIVPYHCTSAYPVEFKDVNLGMVSELRRWSKKASMGFSGHHRGIAIDISAVERGAEWIERHFTLDRTWKGTDHAAALEPDGMRRLVRDLSNLAEASGMKDREILECEVPNRRKLKGEDSSPDTN